MSSKTPTRLICCVDGTYCTPDGPDGRGHGNISNVYRICVSVKVGKCFDEVLRREIIQQKMYEPGIGCTDDINTIERLKAGVFGTGFKATIRRIYEQCCLLDAEDEVWLYGFSRGAYIVRAVAGLLHYIWALQSAGTPSFESEYSKALKIYEDLGHPSTVGPGQFHQFISSKVRPAPQIRFIGVFDTVKALRDENLYNISFNDSIQHFRHALALNEDRQAMKPEVVVHNFEEMKTKLSKRSIIQAWFVGAHIDMGGSAKNDGLALYPLQWVLGESQSKGLVLEFSQFSHDRAKIDNPLRVIFPQEENDGKGHGIWTCRTQNGVEINMQDLRGVHDLQVYGGRYSIKINKRKQFYWSRQAREPFNAAGNLRGYCSFAPQGTIIHPSVYQCMDELVITTSAQNTLQGRENLEIWRAYMLGEDHSVLKQGFWSDRSVLEVDDLKSIRILVCGNAGVGKSTLINRVFGVAPSDEVTETSQRKRGLHDVGQEIRHHGRPDLIIHDSGGFETGDESQVRAVGDFVKSRASQVRIEDRLHIIWFCIEMNSSRTQQTATETVFRGISRYAAEVPIIIIATKMDQFRGIQREEVRDIIEASTPDIFELNRKCQEYAADQIKIRMDMIEKEMQDVEGGHFDACVDVARNDAESLKRLNDVTIQNVRNEKLRLLYVAAQVADIDLKINCAIMETMKIYRDVLGTTSGLGALPLAAMSNRTAAAIAVCKAIVQCFGLPTISPYTIFQIVKSTVWDDLGHNIATVLAEGIATTGIFATVAFAGMPFFLVSGAINIPLIVPATARLMLMLASDLILVLVRAFKETAFTCVGQPQLKDVEKAAVYYHGIARKIHKEILDLVPKSNLIKIYRYNDVRLGLEKTLHRFKEEISKDSDASPLVRSAEESFESDRTFVEKELSEIDGICKATKAELESKPTQTA